jgi:hypothetical protein
VPPPSYDGIARDKTLILRKVKLGGPAAAGH